MTFFIDGFSQIDPDDSNWEIFSAVHKLEDSTRLVRRAKWNALVEIVVSARAVFVAIDVISLGPQKAMFVFISEFLMV